MPGDRSISHRALVLGATAVGETTIEGLPEGDDVPRTAAAMRALGAAVERLGPGSWRVVGRGVGGLVEPADVLDVGSSGTAARLILGLLAGHPIFAVLTGDASLRGQPMLRVTEPLAASGARFSGREGGYLPLAVEGARRPMPLDHRSPAASARVKSAVLLAGLCARGTTRVEEPAPARDHTENMLRHFGASVRVSPRDGSRGGRLIELDGQPELRGAPVRVPGDPSSAAFPLVAALLIPGSRLTVEGIGLNPLRTGLFATLREMGAVLTVSNERVEGGEPVGDVTASHSPLRGVDVPAERTASMIDECLILAVAAACAAGSSRFRGLGEPRFEGGGRLAAMMALLAAGGIAAAVEGDDLLMRRDGAPPAGGGTVAARKDHRVAMSALVLGLAAREAVAVDDASSIGISFPGFDALLNAAAGEPAISGAT